MPTNRVLYVGILVVAASALLWLGAKITGLIEYFLPWSGGIGVLLIIIGLIMELKKPKELTPASSQPPQPEAEPPCDVSPPEDR